MENYQIRQLIQQELPAILRNDPEMRGWVLALTQTQYADKGETESRFDKTLAEIRALREEGNRRWEEGQRELERLREEGNRRWEEGQRELREMREEQNRKWEEQNRKWDANQQELRKMREESQRKFDDMLAEIHTLGQKHDSTIGALGARWGLHSEASFRNALAGILEDSFDVEVLNVTEFDTTGEVFGRPEQVELDIIIQDGLLIICEIKSSISTAEMYTFNRKVEFYEKQHRQQAARKLVISPMVEERAYRVAKELGIEVYSYANDVPTSKP